MNDLEIIECINKKLDKGYTINSMNITNCNKDFEILVGKEKCIKTYYFRIAKNNVSDEIKNKFINKKE